LHLARRRRRIRRRAPGRPGAPQGRRDARCPGGAPHRRTVAEPAAARIHVRMNLAMTRRHLVTLADMGREEMLSLFALADRLREPGRPQLLSGRTVVNLFFEPSTRTRVSFELAAMRLGAQVVPFDVEHSSTQKGETLLDTLRNLEAMGCDQFVVR